MPGVRRHCWKQFRKKHQYHHRSSNASMFLLSGSTCTNPFQCTSVQRRGAHVTNGQHRPNVTFPTQIPHVEMPVNGKTYRTEYGILRTASCSIPPWTHESQLMTPMTQHTTLNSISCLRMLREQDNHVNVMQESCRATVALGVLEVCPLRSRSRKEKHKSCLFSPHERNEKLTSEHSVLLPKLVQVPVV